jgi:hypothetical protein
LSSCPDSSSRREGREFPWRKKTDGKEKIAAAPPSAKPALPAIGCPVLIGVDQIAAWLGISRGRSTMPGVRICGSARAPL